MERTVPFMVILNNHHEEIVSQDNFNYVQILLEKQKEGPENKGERKDLNPMNGLAYCGCCCLPLTKLTTHPGTDYKRNILTCRSISKSSIDYRECDYHEGCTDYELAVKALYEVYDRFFQNERVSADFFKQNIDISITELMEKKYEVDKKKSWMKGVNTIELIENLKHQSLNSQDSRYAPTVNATSL